MSENRKIFNHLPLQRKIYVSCLGPSFDLKGWWVKMSTLHCVNFGYQHAPTSATIIFHFKIYVSCLEPSFDFKGWWVEMSSLHHIYLVVRHNFVGSCTGCLAIDYFQSQRHLLTEKIYHSIRLWAHDFFASASNL